MSFTLSEKSKVETTYFGCESSFVKIIIFCDFDFFCLNHNKCQFDAKQPKKKKKKKLITIDQIKS